MLKEFLTNQKERQANGIYKLNTRGCYRRFNSGVYCSLHSLGYDLGKGKVMQLVIMALIGLAVIIVTNICSDINEEKKNELHL